MPSDILNGHLATVERKLRNPTTPFDFKMVDSEIVRSEPTRPVCPADRSETLPQLVGIVSEGLLLLLVVVIVVPLSGGQCTLVTEGA